MSGIDTYFKIMIESERTAKLFATMIKRYLVRNDIDSNHSQIYLLHVIKQLGKAPVGSVHDIMYPVIINGSYNFSALVRNGYLLSIPNNLDKRSCYLSLTPKGKKLCKDIYDFIENQVKSMEETIDWDQSNSETYLNDLSILQSFLKRAE